MRTVRYCHRSCDSQAAQEANLDGCYGKRGALVAAPPDERSPTDTLNVTRSALDAQGSLRGDE
jgi:hypothetical protein